MVMHATVRPMNDNDMVRGIDAGPMLEGACYGTYEGGCAVLECISLCSYPCTAHCTMVMHATVRSMNGNDMV